MFVARDNDVGGSFDLRDESVTHIKAGRMIHEHGVDDVDRGKFPSFQVSYRTREKLISTSFGVGVDSEAVSSDDYAAIMVSNKVMVFRQIPNKLESCKKIIRRPCFAGWVTAIKVMVAGDN